MSPARERVRTSTSAIARTALVLAWRGERCSAGTTTSCASTPGQQARHRGHPAGLSDTTATTSTRTSAALRLARLPWSARPRVPHLQPRASASTTSTAGSSRSASSRRRGPEGARTPGARRARAGRDDAPDGDAGGGAEQAPLPPQAAEDRTPQGRAGDGRGRPRLPLRRRVAAHSGTCGRRRTGRLETIPKKSARSSSRERSRIARSRRTIPSALRELVSDARVPRGVWPETDQLALVADRDREAEIGAVTAGERQDAAEDNEEPTPRVEAE